MLLWITACAVNRLLIHYSPMNFSGSHTSYVTFKKLIRLVWGFSSGAGHCDVSSYAVCPK